MTEPIVLVVDDNINNLKVLLGVLKEAGFAPRPATSGQQALGMVERVVPDLAILDINMPGMDGLELCSRLRTRPDTAQMPIIFLSAHSESEYAERALAAGGDEYLCKPIDYDRLLFSIGGLMEGTA